MKDNFDAGFIFTLQNHLNVINPKILPQDYYIIVFDQSRQHFIEISEENRKITIDNLNHLPLVQKIIIDAKIYQYVAYRSHKSDVVLLADKFLNTEFIL